MGLCVPIHRLVKRGLLLTCSDYPVCRQCCASPAQFLGGLAVRARRLLGLFRQVLAVSSER